MTAAKRSQLATFDDFCFHIHDGEKGDLIDGVITMASPENTDANDMFLWLAGLLHSYVRRKKLGRVFGSRVAFQLDDYNGPEPDIAFVAKTSVARIRKGRVLGAPDVAIEIVSPDSIERDYLKKRKQYQGFGVSEYWILDELQKKSTFLRLDDTGKYRTVKTPSGIFRSEAVEGFWLKTDWIWPEEQPDLLETLQTILES